MPTESALRSRTGEDGLLLCLRALRYAVHVTSLLDWARAVRLGRARPLRSSGPRRLSDLAERPQRRGQLHSSSAQLRSCASLRRHMVASPSMSLALAMAINASLP